MKGKNLEQILKRVALTLGWFMLTCGASAEMLMSTNFENAEDGTAYSRPQWQADGFVTGTWDNGLEKRTELTNSCSVSGTKSLKVMYPKGEFGPANSGCQVPLLMEPRPEAYMSYSVRFSENFTWGTSNYGGKLPGLAGGDNCSGLRKCDGTNGWTTRYMWRTGGRIGLYLYDMAHSGVDFQLYHKDGTPVRVRPGEWIHLAQRVKMNSAPTVADGEVQVWANGEEVLFLEGCQFTTNGDKIDKLYISTFHGGDDETWCPIDTCYTYFDDFCVGTTYVDVCQQKCRKPSLGNDVALCHANGPVVLKANLPKEYGLRWYFNGKMLNDNSDELEVKNTGTYVVVADSGRCVTSDTVEVTTQPNLSLPETVNLCSQSFVTLDCGADATADCQWTKDGVVMAGENNSTLLVNAPGVYTVLVSAGECMPAEATTKVTSGLISIADVEGKVGDEVVLTPENEGTYDWYKSLDDAPVNAETYAVKVDEGVNYVYVKDGNGVNGLVGKKALSENMYHRTATEDENVQFVVKRDLTLDSLSVYPSEPMDVVIRITNEDNGLLVFCKTYYDLRGGMEERLPIELNLPKGHYHIDAAGSTGQFFHSHTDADISYPYSIDGVIDITGCGKAWMNKWYLYFYNWRVTSGNYCAAKAIKVSGVQETAHNLVQADDFDIKVTGDELTIDGTKVVSMARLFNANGHAVAVYGKMHNKKMTINLKKFRPGVYMLEVNGDRTTTRKIVIR
ncbi:MAG: T9SS type A sorting domain-containing protein [Paludibacteraceae bacterium]|nr:T9SS type A sorting domain-containing protein [Paludibacteraceae bacterium]